MRTKTWDLERRIRRAWEDAKPCERATGSQWYADAKRAIYDESVRLELALGLQPDGFHTLAGVVAALSPGLRWERNVFWARELAEAWQRGRAETMKDIPTYSYANVRKAIRILAGEAPEAVLSGPKVTAFYRLIVSGGRSDDVCVDGHAYALAIGWDGNIRDSMTDDVDRTTVRISKPEFRRVMLAYRRLAHKVGVPVSTLQAVTWLVRKRWRMEK